jgi:hypothetical protein
MGWRCECANNLDRLHRQVKYSIRDSWPQSITIQRLWRTSTITAWETVSAGTKPKVEGFRTFHAFNDAHLRGAWLGVLVVTESRSNIRHTALRQDNAKPAVLRTPDLGL